MKEEAKAIQESAKAVKKGLDVTEKFGSFFSKIFGEGFAHLGASFSDWSKYFRYQNFLKLQDKVELLHQKRGVSGRTVPIPTRYALPLLESASVEDEENIQDKWAGLIANATDPNERLEFQKIYIQILSCLEPLDAMLLDLLTQQLDAIKTEESEKPKLNSENLSKMLGTDKSAISLSLSNLFRLGCILDSYENEYFATTEGLQGFRVNNPQSNFRLSQLGRMLMNACKTT